MESENTRAERALRDHLAPPFYIRNEETEAQREEKKKQVT